MRIIKMVSFTLLFVVGMSMGMVLADSPHFVGDAATSIDTAGCSSLPQPSTCGDANVSFKEAGLGSAVTIIYDFTGNATADWGCINGGGNHPKASNKTTVSGPVSSTASFTSTKAGNITGSLSVGPPTPAPFCPSGQTEVLADVTYTDLALTDTINHITIDGTPSSLSATFFKFE